MLKYITMLPIFFIFVGCCPFDKQPIKSVSLAELHENIRKNCKLINDFSILDLSGNNKYCLQRAEMYIKEQQKYYNNPNPMIVFYENFTLELNGTISSKGELKIAAAPEGNAYISKETEQKINWPISVGSLSALPDQYLKLRLGLIQSYKDILDDDQKLKLVKEVMLDYNTLKQRVDKLKSDYIPQK